MRAKSIKIRVSIDELECLRARSQRIELARWMREHCLKPAGNDEAVIPASLIRFVRAAGNNLNQIAKKVNYAAKAEKISETTAIDVLFELEAIRQALEAQIAG